MDYGQLFIEVVRGILALLIVVGVFGVVLVLSRELTAWYFKTNEIIKLLKQIEENTQETDE
jgi:hypothetical protein